MWELGLGLGVGVEGTYAGGLMEETGSGFWCDMLVEDVHDGGVGKNAHSNVAARTSGCEDVRYVVRVGGAEGAE